MKWFKLSLLHLALLTAATPLLLLIAKLLAHPDSWLAWNEWDRIGSLLGNTLLLALLTLVFAIPAGSVIALTWDDWPTLGKRVLGMCIGLGLFIPLPVYAIAWQVILGSWLPSMALAPGEIAWRPWSQGLLPAAWVHACASLPWVVVMIWAGLRTANRDLEEDACLIGGPRLVLRLVILPRMMLSMAVASLWVFVQVFTEIPVTDVMMVRTFSEEVYTQIVGYPSGVLSSLALLLPSTLVLTALFAILFTRFRDRLQLGDFELKPRWFRVQWLLSRRFLLPFLALGMACWSLLPLAALIWKACGGGTRERSLGIAGQEFARTLRLYSGDILDSYFWSLLTGIVAVTLACLVWWIIRGTPKIRSFVLLLLIVLWLLPGPVIGLGVKETIQHLIEREHSTLQAVHWDLEFPPLRTALYDQPSPLPGMWVCLLRFAPFAFAVTWVVLDSIPRGLWEQATLDGASAWSQWRLVVWPNVHSSLLGVAIAVGMLSLCELSARKLVVPPGRREYVLELFSQAHYGAEASVASMCLVQVIICMLGASALAILISQQRPRSTERTTAVRTAIDS